MNLKINHLAVIVCIVLVHALGFLWYGVLFAEPWMRMVGIDPASPPKDPGGAIWVLNAVAIIAPIYLLAWLFTKLNVTSAVRGAVLGFLITFCFHHLSTMNANMFAGEPYGLAWIQGGYMMTGMTLSGLILGVWTKRENA